MILVDTNTWVGIIRHATAGLQARWLQTPLQAALRIKNGTQLRASGLTLRCPYCNGTLSDSVNRGQNGLSPAVHIYRATTPFIPG
jgi:hypothetical protein